MAKKQQTTNKKPPSTTDTTPHVYGPYKEWHFQDQAILNMYEVSEFNHRHETCVIIMHKVYNIENKTVDEAYSFRVTKCSKQCTQRVAAEAGASNGLTDLC